MLSRRHIAILHDMFWAALSFPAALYLRWGSSVVDFGQHILIPGSLLFTLIALLVFTLLKINQGLWRYASLQDLYSLTKAVTISIIVFYVLLFILTRLEGVPRSAPAIQWLLLLAMLGGPRFLFRMWKDRTLAPNLGEIEGQQIPVLVVGTSAQGEQFVRETRRNPLSPYRVVAMAADDPEEIGNRIHGVPIYGPLSSLEHIIGKVARKHTRPRKLVLANDIEGEALESILAIADKVGLGLARLPRATELKSGTGETLSIRPVAIEDVLGRAQNAQDKEGMRAFIEGRRILVTGAGGSIGSELARQISGFGPASLTLLDASEYNLYNIDAEISELAKEMPRRAVLADVRDKDVVAALFHELKPEIVFHAAAIKHVPIAEQNISETVRTNILGSANVADAAVAAGALAVVQVSTDKAVNPANIMGASKRVAEIYAQALGMAQEKTRFITVRFGNVLGSTGSVVPLFQKQLARGGPLTVTHQDMVRYFMTVREAAGLVIQAGEQGSKAAEPRAPIFILDMGKPVRIEDLALQMIRLAGFTPHTDIKIEYTGLRPGEKLFEELFHAKENLSITSHKSILLAHPREETLETMRRSLARIETLANARDGTGLRTLLHELVPEFIEPE